MTAGLEKKNANWGETLTTVDNCHQRPFLIVAEQTSLVGGLQVACRWLVGAYWLPTACLPNGFGAALKWLWVALSGLCPGAGTPGKEQLEPRNTRNTRNRGHLARLGFPPNGCAVFSS